MSFSKRTHYIQYAYDTELGRQGRHRTRTFDRNVVRLLDLDAGLGGLDRVVVELVVVGTATTDPRLVGPVVGKNADLKDNGEGQAEYATQSRQRKRNMQIIGGQAQLPGICTEQRGNLKFPSSRVFTGAAATKRQMPENVPRSR